METQIPKGWRQVALRSVCEPTRIWNPIREPRDEFWYVDVSAVERESLSIQSPQLVKAAQAPSRARKIIQTGDAIFATVRPTLRRIAFVAEKFNNQIASTAFCIVRANRQEAVPHFLYYALQTEFFNEEIAKFQSGASYPAVNDKDVLNQMIGVPPKPEQEKIASALLKIQRSVEAEAKLVATAHELKQSAMHQLFTHGLRNEPQKETDIGQIPKSWDVIPFAKAYETQLGKMLSPKAHISGSPKPYLRNKNVQWGFIDMSDIAKMDFDQKEMSKFRLETGDLLICEGGVIGRAAIWRGELKDCFFQKALHRVRPIDAKATNEFLAYWLMYAFEVAKVYRFGGASSTIEHLPATQLKRIPIPNPLLDEQNEIAAILQTIDRKISVHERKRAALSDLFQTLLHQLMTAQIRVDKLDIDTSEVTA
jgi:type I restriction enzyme S subunit